jgi:adenylyltransferase/sulfurtransferase
LTVDLWQLKFDQVPLGSPRPDCPTCSSRRFDFLDRARPSQATVLCGHDAIQVLPEPGLILDLQALAERLRPVGKVMVSRFLLRFDEPTGGRRLTVFPDGRAIIKGTTDESEARSLYARFVGA